MRPPLSSLGLVVALGVALGVPRDGGAAGMALSCPTAARSGARFVVEVKADVGATAALGAYSATLGYDPAVLTVVSVAGGDTTEFARPPTRNSPSPGTTNISAFQTVSLDSPKGNLSVAKVTFEVAATTPATSSIGLTISHLFDTSSVAIVPVAGTGCTVAVTPS